MFFKILASRFLAFFGKTFIFFQFSDIVIFQVFSASGVWKSPLGFDNNLRENFFGHALVFNFLISQIVAIFDKTVNFFEMFFQFLGCSSL